MVFDREEDYRGALTVAAESLPPGVSAAVGADFEPDKDPPPRSGNASATRRGRSERLSSSRADSDAPSHGSAVKRSVYRCARWWMANSATYFRQKRFT